MVKTFVHSIVGRLRDLKSLYKAIGGCADSPCTIYLYWYLFGEIMEGPSGTVLEDGRKD